MQERTLPRPRAGLVAEALAARAPRPRPRAAGVFFSAPPFACTDQKHDNPTPYCCCHVMCML